MVLVVPQPPFPPFPTPTQPLAVDTHLVGLELSFRRRLQLRLGRARLSAAVRLSAGLESPDPTRVPGHPCKALLGPLTGRREAFPWGPSTFLTVAGTEALNTEGEARTPPGVHPPPRAICRCERRGRGTRRPGMPLYGL